MNSAAPLPAALPGASAAAATAPPPDDIMAPPPDDTPAQPRWLDDAERQAWLALAALMIRLPGALDAQLQRDASLTQFEYFVLAHLSESPAGQARMSDLAARANGSPSRLSHVVARLERRGYIARQACPADGRYTNAVLTAAGLAKVVATAPGHVERVRELVLDALAPDELELFGRSCAQILARIDSADGTVNRPCDEYPGGDPDYPGGGGCLEPARASR